MNPITPLAAYIQRQIDNLHPTSLGDWTLRVCKEELNALPLHGNIIYLWAIRPDKTILCMDHESLNHPTEIETDALTLYAVLEHGARIYPELQTIVPPRPEGAQPCDLCQGKITNDHCFKCSSLGWFIFDE